MFRYLVTQIGQWESDGGITIDDIYWPENAATPPEGRPAKYKVKVVTLKELPYVIYNDPDPNTGKCPPQSKLCRVAPLNKTRE